MPDQNILDAVAEAIMDEIDADASRDDIARAALSAFREHTPSPRTVDEIARVLGDEEGAIYRYECRTPLPEISFRAIQFRRRPWWRLLRDKFRSACRAWRVA